MELVLTFFSLPEGTDVTITKRRRVHPSVTCRRRTSSREGVLTQYFGVHTERILWVNTNEQRNADWMGVKQTNDTNTIGQRFHQKKKRRRRNTWPDSPCQSCFQSPHAPLRKCRVLPYKVAVPPEAHQRPTELPGTVLGCAEVRLCRPMNHRCFLLWAI